jgi:ribonucleotide monophosphatase NagD (HAD superfamily)
VIIGKPHAPIVKALVQKTGFSVDQLVMIGDRLYTDIALGQSGMITVLVLSGETCLEDIPASPFQPDFIFRDLEELHMKLRERF